MTTPSGASPDENPWRRPAAPPTDAAGSTAPGTSNPYLGPPRTAQPPAGWRPPVHLQPPPPRRLPTQDVAALDEAERRARSLTWGLGIAAGVVTLVLIFLLCARVVF